MKHSSACCELIMILLVVAVFSLTLVEAGEMTFELPDKEKMCFHERIDKGTKAMLEFQVIQGGNYDVDMVLTSPQDNAVLYKVQKKQYDRHEWTAEVGGDFKFCFSNEFSTFTHKIIYFDLQVGDEDAIKTGSQSPLTAMTQMESSVMSTHQNLKVVIDYQTHHRLRESQGRSSAEDLNERVQYWSIGQTIVIIVVSIGQIVVLRSFFTDRKQHSLYNARS